MVKQRGGHTCIEELTYGVRVKIWSRVGWGGGGGGGGSIFYEYLDKIADLSKTVDDRLTD